MRPTSFAAKDSSFQAPSSIISFTNLKHHWHLASYKHRHTRPFHPNTVKCSAILATMVACATVAAAGPVSKRQIDLCANLLDSSPLCCEASVAGVLNLSCSPRMFALLCVAIQRRSANTYVDAT